VFGEYIGTVLSGGTNYGSNIGEYMPQQGRIYGGTINFALKDNSTSNSYYVYGTNYGSSTNSGRFPTTIQPINPGVIINSSLGNLQGSCSNWFSTPIPFNAGDYIGIFIDFVLGAVPGTGVTIPDPIAIEGTLYIRFDNLAAGRFGYINAAPW
jgi:hypothetical protein